MAKQKNTPPRICDICGKELFEDESFEYVKTRRGTEMYFCKKCIGGMKSGRNQKH